MPDISLSPATEPYYSDASVTIYLGDCRDILPTLAPAALILADPPYAETSLEWDRWPEGWPTMLATCAPQLWCFGSMRMFLDRRDEYADWRFAQEIVWEKHNGSGFHADRFRRVHEFATHWYQGDWSAQAHNVQVTMDATKRTVRRKARPAHMGDIQRGAYASEDGGPKLMRSVLRVRSEHGTAQHPTQKPLGILDPLIAYSTAPGDTVFVPFVGAGSELLAARQAGRLAIGCETDEKYCEIAAKRLSVGEMFGAMA